MMVCCLIDLKLGWYLLCTFMTSLSIYEEGELQLGAMCIAIMLLVMGSMHWLQLLTRHAKCSCDDAVAILTAFLYILGLCDTSPAEVLQGFIRKLALGGGGSELVGRHSHLSVHRRCLRGGNGCHGWGNALTPPTPHLHTYM